MAIEDSDGLVFECPLCQSLNIINHYWPGAWLNNGSGMFRVFLLEGQTQEVDCSCIDCGHSWSEYVVGKKDKRMI